MMNCGPNFPWQLLFCNFAGRWCFWRWCWFRRRGRRGTAVPLGSSPQADQGAAEIAAALADAPYGTVLYDHWFSWQWRYHLFDKRVFVSWFPHASALATDLTAFGQDGSPRYLALPNTAVADPIRRTVQEAGFTLTAVAHSDHIILYEINPQITQISQIKPKICVICEICG